MRGVDDCALLFEINICSRTPDTASLQICTFPVRSLASVNIWLIKSKHVKQCCINWDSNHAIACECWSDAVRTFLLRVHYVQSKRVTIWVIHLSNEHKNSHICIFFSLGNFSLVLRDAVKWNVIETHGVLTCSQLETLHHCISDR